MQSMRCVHRICSDDPSQVKSCHLQSLILGFLAWISVWCWETRDACCNLQRGRSIGCALGFHTMSPRCLVQIEVWWYISSWWVHLSQTSPVLTCFLENCSSLSTQLSTGSAVVYVCMAHYRHQNALFLTFLDCDTLDTFDITDSKTVWLWFNELNFLA